MVPPNRDLPPPERDGVALRNNPAWPNDPDIARARADAAQRRNRNIQAEMEKEQDPLRRDELDPPRHPGVAAGRHRKDQVGELSPDITGRYRLTPQELGTKSFFGLFGKSDPEVKRFTGEPARTALTKPPAGYQVPSPDQPYGLGKEVVKQKATNYLETHGTVDADR